MSADDKAKLHRQVAGVDELTLAQRMRQTGFWPAGQGVPEEPSAERDERLALEGIVRRLTGAHRSAEELDAELARERVRRIAASREKRASAAKARAEAKALRKAAHQARLKADVVHLGLGVSAQLEERVSDVARLAQRQLPVLHTAHEVAQALGLSLGQLRYLTYHRDDAVAVHYHRFTIPKKTGGRRAISAPKPTLAKAQRWLFENVLGRLEVTQVAHGFVKGRNVVSNARPHLRQKVVINLDLRDFFPTFTFARVRGMFRGMGYSGQVATLFALLCTEPPRVEVSLDGSTSFVALGARVLPQGACTSPALTNFACRRLDARLARLAEVNGFAFTRYADDLTFSGDAAGPVGRLLRSVRAVLGSEGFVEHEAKTHVMRSGRRQEVTGVVVNERPGIGRDELRTLRAMLHNAAKHGLESQNREGHQDFAAFLRGRVAWACMVDPSKKPKLEAALRAALGPRRA